MEKEKEKKAAAKVVKQKTRREKAMEKAKARRKRALERAEANKKRAEQKKLATNDKSQTDSKKAATVKTAEPPVMVNLGQKAVKSNPIAGEKVPVTVMQAGEVLRQPTAVANFLKAHPKSQLTIRGNKTDVELARKQLVRRYSINMSRINLVSEK